MRRPTPMRRSSSMPTTWCAATPLISSPTSVATRSKLRRQGLFTFKRGAGSKQKAAHHTARVSWPWPPRRSPAARPAICICTSSCSLERLEPGRAAPDHADRHRRRPAKSPDAARSTNPDITRYGLVVDFSAPRHPAQAALRPRSTGRGRAWSIWPGTASSRTRPGALAARRADAAHHATRAGSRWPAPPLALRHSIKGSPGESMARMVDSQRL